MPTLSATGMGARLQRFGANASGSLTKISLIASTQVPSVTQGLGNFLFVEKMKVTVAKSGSNSLFQLELSTDNSSFTEVARIEVPDYGIVSDPDFGIYIPAGYYYRVSITQSTIARCSAALLGRAAISDIVDI